MKNNLIINGGKDRYEFIDYLKGFSIISIILYHLFQFLNINPIINKLVAFGGTGGIVFFFCSGFGLYASQKKKELSFLQFIKKKFIKIYIPYIIVVLILFCIPYTFVGNFDERVHALLSHIFLFKMFNENLIGSFSYPLWFMSTLFQLYLVFIPLYKLRNKIGSKWFIILTLIISLAWSSYVAYIKLAYVRVYNSFFFQYLWVFAIGMCFADKLSDKKYKITINYYLLALISIIGVLIGGYLGIKGGVLTCYNDIFLVVGYMGISIIIGSLIKFIFKLCTNVNKISYELYLIHGVIMEGCFGYATDSLVIKILLGIISLILSFIVSIGINKLKKIKK